MAVLSALRRFVRLGCWVGLGAGAMLIDVCSSGVGVRSRDSAPDLPTQAVPDASATPDAGRGAQAADVQTADTDHAQPADGGTTDLWDTICE
jgi:hypothetical protein